MNNALLEIVTLLAAAVLIVPVTQRLGLGSVLGYLLAGLVLGPSCFSVIKSTEQLQEVSELGVVFLLFLIGLELDPKRLWQLKIPIFGMGLAQLALISSITMGLAVLFGHSWQAGLILGMGLTMSSTAISMQILKERNLVATSGGSSAFSVLLFQDIAVIPILALLPLLAGEKEQSQMQQPVWRIILVIAGVVVFGRLLLRHVFRLVASANLREVFTALCLLIVVGLAALMLSLGVEMALGAFLGGVLLATSEYRHAIETDIEPFKGLLLGLFFMSVGQSVDLHTIAMQPARVLVLLVTVVVLKVLVHVLLGWAFRLRRREIPLFALVISQVGEFAFVLFAAANALGLLTAEDTAIWAAVVALSMGTTPLLLLLYDRTIAPRLVKSADMSDEVIVDDQPEVLIAGFGRVGQIVARLLYANRISATVLDHDPEQIEAVRRFGFKIYYGDVTRLDLITGAGAAHAKVLVVAVDDVDDSIALVDMAKEHFPHLRIVARARNVAHVYKLIERGVEIWERETFDSSLRMGTEVLRVLGWSPYQSVRAGLKFRAHNIKQIHDQFTRRDDDRAVRSVAKQAREDLEKMFARDFAGRQADDPSWDIHPEGR